MDKKTTGVIMIIIGIIPFFLWLCMGIYTAIGGTSFMGSSVDGFQGFSLAMIAGAIWLAPFLLIGLILFIIGLCMIATVKKSS